MRPPSSLSDALRLELIEPHACVEPGYSKLQVGIYVAAIQDTMDRKRQQLPPPVSQPPPATVAP